MTRSSEPNSFATWVAGATRQSAQISVPETLRPVVTFAYVTGWRVPSEVLTLEWRQVDLDAGTVRLDSGQTKNGQGRLFPMTTELRTLLKAQDEARKKTGQIVARVFFRMVAKGRRGAKSPKAITSFTLLFGRPYSLVSPDIWAPLFPSCSQV